MEEKMLRRTWAEIDLDALTHNFETLRKHTGAPLVGVVDRKSTRLNSSHMA